MNHSELLHNGHHTLCEAINGLAENEWQLPGVVGEWSVKDLIAHLAAYEQVLVELLSSLLGNGRLTPTLDRFCAQYTLAFDEDEVVCRRTQTVGEVLAEYEVAQAQILLLLPQIPETVRWTQGVQPWAGSPYDLEDFLIYTAYGHKQEHGAQITAFRNRLTRQRSHEIPKSRTSRPITMASAAQRRNTPLLSAYPAFAVRVHTS
jgi:hypothetical protein